MESIDDLGVRSEPKLRPIITDALRFWEPRRLLYNGVLFVETLGLLGVRQLLPGTPGWQGRILALLVLGAIANLCYCAAYPVDIFLQCSDFATPWRRWRALLFLAGLGLASILAYICLFCFGAPMMA